MEKLYQHRIPWVLATAMGLLWLGGCATQRSPEKNRQIVRAWTGTHTQAPRWRKADTGPIIAHKKADAPAATPGSNPTPPKTVVKASDKVVQLLIKEAESYLGTPYAWGGMSRKGVDCSGYMVLIFRTVGIELPRISPDQYKYGKDVALKHIQPGDLMFFWNYKQGVIGHTALCVEVNDGVARFIHAASSDVRYDDLNNSYWTQHYMCASRVLHTKEQASR